MLDLVKLDVRKEGTPPDIPMLEVAYVPDGLPVGWEMKWIFKELIDSLEFKKTFEFRLEDICPRKTRIELMQQVCGLSHTTTAVRHVHQVAVAAAKGRPPKPPKKQRKVTFIDRPTVVTCDVLDELGAEYMRRNEARCQSMQMPWTSQVGITQKATTVENQATTLEMQATMTNSKTTPGFDHSSKPSMPREDPFAHSRNSVPDARKLSVDAKESYVKQLQASTSADWATQNKSSATHCLVQASLPGMSVDPLLTPKAHTVKPTSSQMLLPVLASQVNNEARGGHIQPKIIVKQPASSPLTILKKSPSTKHHPAMVRKRETLGDLNGCGQQKQHAIEKKEKSITRTTANKENQPPEMSRVELSEAAKIDDIRTKCIVTSSKLDQGQLGSTIAMGDEYCPAPPFNIGLDEIFGPSMVEDLARPAGMFDDCRQQNGYELQSVDIPGTSIDEGVLEVELSKQIIGASSGNLDMCPEAKGKTPTVIEIPDDDLLWDLE